MPRAFFHDYHSRSIYHITLTKATNVPAFGSLAGGVENSHIILSSLGKIITSAIFELPKREPAIKILQYIIMPDHMHVLIFVTERTKKALGSYIGMLKVLSGQLYREQTGINQTIFNPDYDDRILHSSRNLDTIFSYIKSNPYRLAVKLAHPEFFQRINRIEIGGQYYSAYGNFQLLANPFKAQVVVHRADSPELLLSKKASWLHIAGNGGVLVSPFISREEKGVRTEAEALGAKVILIIPEEFPERFKPAAHDFDLCATGMLLIISMGFPPRTELSRHMCLQMNALAEGLALS